jgi:hypothetical protein
MLWGGAFIQESELRYLGSIQFDNSPAVDIEFELSPSVDVRLDLSPSISIEEK